MVACTYPGLIAACHGLHRRTCQVILQMGSAYRALLVITLCRLCSTSIFPANFWLEIVFRPANESKTLHNIIRTGWRSSHHCIFVLAASAQNILGMWTLPQHSHTICNPMHLIGDKNNYLPKYKLIIA